MNGAVVFILNDLDERWGMERQALLLASTLAARGREIVVLAGENVDASWPALLPRAPARRDQLHVLRVPVLRGIPLAVAHELALFEAAWLLRGRQVDAIYAVHVTTGPLARDLGRLLAVPWVVKLAGGAVTGDIAGTVRDPAGPIQLEALRAADRVVCLSAQIEDEVRSTGVARDRLVRLPNGVDAAALRQAAPRSAEELGLGPGDAAVLFVGRLDPGKRIDLLLRAVSGLPSARLLIAGAGPEEAALRALAHELGLVERVRFLGLRDDVPRLLKTTRVLALPSIAEGMSNALLEALAAGTPIVTTRIPANEALVDDTTAWLVPPGDVEALSAALGEALADPEEAARRAERGQRRVEERFDIARVAEAHERLFQELGRAGPRRLAVLSERTRHTRAWLVDRAGHGARWAVSKAVVAVKRAAGLD